MRGEVVKLLEVAGMDGEEGPGRIISGVDHEKRGMYWELLLQKIML